jgi:hypothetical protein
LFSTSSGSGTISTAATVSYSSTSTTGTTTGAGAARCSVAACGDRVTAERRSQTSEHVVEPDEHFVFLLRERREWRAASRRGDELATRVAPLESAKSVRVRSDRLPRLIVRGL